MCYSICSELLYQDHKSDLTVKFLDEWRDTKALRL